ncbi:glycosyltransferase family 2 protein [Synergistaceae bacterium OttesenSCG-928-I11]|nr:glycosyltransferase family 2 protein [Synergistaceae bacterium OttesenSCG-928-I11]
MISILCPCYNEEEALPSFRREVTRVMEEAGEPFEIVFVNDGSDDGTLDIMRALAQQDQRIVVVDLSRNFGKEAALTAALDHARGDAVVPMDADLQDPPALIPEMIARWRDGYDVVLARRDDRPGDTYAKRSSAGLFYWLFNKFSQTKIPENVGDFRLMDRRVVDAVGALRERNRFMRGIFAWAGFKACAISFERERRSAGETKFNASMMWRTAMDAMASFCPRPLTMWLYIGAAVSLASFGYGAYIVVRTLVLGRDVPGYASLLCLVLFFGGLQTLGIGILGEYLGRTYVESKRRPIYLVREVYGPSKKNSGTDARNEI